jgi:hypothetical protein
MAITLSGVTTNVVAGQIALTWDPTKLTLAASNPISAGDAPFVVYSTINSAAGTATILVSIQPGSTGAPVQSKVVARLKFVTVAAACSGAGTSVDFFPGGTLPTEFTNGTGGSVVPQLVPSATFIVDDGSAPVFSNVPQNRTAQATAGEGQFAILAPIGTPTVADACTGSPGYTWSRSDGAQQLDAKWPVGTTTVTWRSSDTCGNTSTATTTVTVQAYNTMTFTAGWVNPFGANAVRPVTVTVLGGAGPVTRTVNATVAANGTSSFSITDLPIDTYTCATLEDATRSLRRKVAVSDGGTTWTAANAQLVLGDIIADEVIDVLDWGAYVVNNPNADLNSDGVINATDGNIILANFGTRGDTACGSAFVEAPQPIVSITVDELVRLGLPELVAADLNHDGVLDEADIALYLRQNGG